MPGLTDFSVGATVGSVVVVVVVVVVSSAGLSLSLLHAAVKGKQLRVAKLLISRGAFVNAVDARQYTDLCLERAQFIEAAAADTRWWGRLLPG